MAKTKPIGVRFDEDLLNEFKEKGYVATAQGALTLLEEFYKGTKLMHMVVKEDVVEKEKEPEPEQKEVPSWKAKYDEYIKNQNKKTKK